jgi:ribosomal protein S20
MSNIRSAAKGARQTEVRILRSRAFLGRVKRFRKKLPETPPSHADQ